MRRVALRSAWRQDSQLEVHQADEAIDRLCRRRRHLHHLQSDPRPFAFKPTSEKSLAFAPGQYVEITLGHPRADSRGNRRFFTLASSPTEGLVRLGVRFSKPGSSFKRALLALGSSGQVMAGHIAGDFTLPRDRRQKLVFLAGGIGITPFRSMLRYLLDTKQRRDIVVLYAN